MNCNKKFNDYNSYFKSKRVESEICRFINDYSVINGGTINGDLTINGDTVMNGDLEISGNFLMMGDLDMACNLINDVSGINFCDGTYIGHGASFDISTNEVFKINQDAFVIDQNRNIGIKTTNPQNTLDIRGGVNVNGRINMEDKENLGNYYSVLYNATGGNTLLRSSPTTDTIVLQNSNLTNPFASFSPTEINMRRDMNMNKNLINDVSGINFCDGTYIGHGDSFDISTNEVLHLKTSQNIVIDGDTKFNNNVSIVGNLNIQGTTTSISTQDLIVNDNIIFINQTMDSCGNPTQDVLPDPSNIISGFSVYRGPILPGDIVRDEYQFVYDESSNSFRIGISGETQPVATREDLPTENGVAVWDVSTNKFITNKGLTMDNGGVFKIDNSLNKVLSQVQTLNGTIFTGSSNNTRFGDISNNLIFSLGGKGMAIGTFNAGENLIFGVDNTEIMRIDGSSYDVIISGGDLDMCCNLINDVSGINFCGGSVINNAGMDISGLTTLDNLDVIGVVSINNLEVSGNVVIRNGDLDMCCNLINDVSGINFCDGTYIGHGASFDISANDVLVLSGVKDICGNYNGASIVSKNRVYQELNSDNSWNSVNGYMGLAKDAHPRISNAASIKTLSNLIMISNTGSNWHGVTWSPELNLFVAVARNGGFGKSSDGINWEIYSDVTDGSPNRVIWAKKQYRNEGIFVACAIGTTPNTQSIATSPDGVIWTPRDSQITTGIFDLTWSPELGILLGCSSDSSFNGSLIISYDFGVSWTPINTILNKVFLGVTWSPEIGIFVAVGPIGSAISKDGINWVENATTDGLREVVWSSKLGLFVAPANIVGNKIQVSTDGIDWKPVITPSTIDNVIRCLEWSDELGMFIACASGGTKTIMYSFNGINWFDIDTTISVRGVVWSPELGLFLFVTNSSTVYLSSLKGRPPTSYNVFDSSFNNIDQSGNWTFKVNELYNDDGIVINGNLDMSCNLINDVSGINFCGGSVINNAGMDISGLTTLDNLDVTGVTSINNLEVSGNVVIRNGDLDMCCNLINDVSGINFCDGTYIGNNISVPTRFDISFNKTTRVYGSDIDFFNVKSITTSQGLENGFSFNVKDVNDGGNPDNFYLTIDNNGEGAFYCKTFEIGDGEGSYDGPLINGNTYGINFYDISGNYIFQKLKQTTAINSKLMVYNTITENIGCLSGNLILDTNLDMCCNLINDVSGINFCDGTYIGHGSSFDISTNEVLHISTSQNIIIDGDVSFNNNIEISGNIVAKNLTEKNNDTNVHYNTSTGEITYSKQKLDLFNFSGFQRERINITDITGL